MSGVLPLLLTGYVTPILSNIVVTNIGSSTGTTTTARVIILGAAIPAGSLICVTGVFNGTTVTNLTVTNSGAAQTWVGNTLAINPGLTGAKSRTGLFYAYNSIAMAAGATITLTATGSAYSLSAMQAFYATNILTASTPLDGYSSAFAPNPLAFAATVNPATLTGTATTGAVDLLVYSHVVSAYYANPVTFTQTAGWTNPSTNLVIGGTSGIILGSGYKIVASGTAKTITNTTAYQGVSAYNPWSLQLIGFKKA